ncbi:hypothetical protein GGF40_001305 [Coemansia sp. RSA 1286]|nr:hypothetical protein IWW45_002640 [Coemansia sp. RSA 485]KAJ2638902.1 hypothetical protein GGF40_001305 [Coemansia sp. RSA 1286]
MSKPSSFQTLPTNVIRNIVEFSVNTHCPDARINSDYGINILHSCHRWRAALATNILSNVSIKTFTNNPPVCVFGKWPTSIGTPQFPTVHLVKTVKFYYREWESIKQSSAVDLFNQTIFPNSAFTSARVFEIYINFIGKFDTPESMETLRQILFSLKQKTPNVKKMVILAGHIMAPLQGTNTSEFLKSIVIEFNVGVKNLDYRMSFPRIIKYFSPTQFTGITNLAFDCFREPRSLLVMVHPNAPTLQSLRMLDIWTDCFQAMLYNDNKPVVYPCLKSMYLRFTAECFDQADHSVVHFPMLNGLTLLCNNLVYSKALFNNTGSLEHLKLTLEPRILAEVNPQKVFSQKQFGNLQSLIFNIDLRGQTVNVTSFINPILGLPQALRRLEFSGRVSEDNFLSTLMAHPDSVYAKIQELTIGSVELDISETISILQKMPYLTKFVLSVKNVQPELNGTTDANVAVNYIKRSFNPINRYIAKLSITNSPYTDVPKYDAIFVALLIVGCPRLGYASVRRLSNNRFTLALLDLADTEAFAAYKQQIDLVIRNHTIVI